MFTYQSFLQPGPITPWGKIGERLLVKRVQKFVLYLINYVEQIPLANPIVRDFGSIAANTTSAGVSLQTPLEMDGAEIAQWRIKLLDDLVLQINQPQNLPRFLAKNARSRITKWGQMFDPFDAMSEIAVFQDEYPYVDVINPTDYTQVTTRVAFYGFRYRLSELQVVERIEQVQGGYTAVMGEGFVGSGFQRGGLR